MKDKIRQILREETSGFDEKTLKVLYQYMNFLTKDYVWYYDTPEQRFEWSPGSIWLINPKTEEWALELEKGGKLWWNWDFYYNFQRYFNMEESDYVKFITLLVEDVINRGVSSTRTGEGFESLAVEDVLNRGVSSTVNHGAQRARWVEDVLKNEEELK
jgi:hypothetical protein